MKKTILSRTLAVAALVGLVATSANARSWRINSDVAKKAHFTDINAAMSSDDVAGGDTLYLDPGTRLTATQNVTKQVTIVGCGYLLSTIQPAEISGELFLKASNVKLEGIDVTGRLDMAANDCVVERCKLREIVNNGTAQRAVVRQCYLPDGYISGAGTSSTNTIGWTIENCIIILSRDYDPIRNLYQPVIRNNYIRPNYYSASGSLKYLTEAVITDNIFINTRYIGSADLVACTNCTLRNNIFHIADYATTYPGNIIIDSNTEEAIFALEGTDDQRYRLKEDSPARGAATTGGDCGPFGGIYPYVCCGYPLGIPHFEQSNVANRPTDGQLRITQKVELQAE